MDAFCRALPKVELHAHLNGSLSAATIQKLLALKKSDLKLEYVQHVSTIADNDTRTLDECFELFGVIHALVDTPDALAITTREVITEFWNDNVVYLELRSTPKNYAAMSKRVYVETILRVMQECHEELGIWVRLIVSADRGKPLEDAIENYLLAAEYRSQGVVGVDLCGNPSLGDAITFVPAICLARQRGLRVTLHTAEIDRSGDTSMLVLTHPDRIGHGTCLALAPQALKLCRHWGIPIEVCLTSNLKAKTVESLQDHHLGDLLGARHDYALCTDDKGVFSTTLSAEFALAAAGFSLSKDDLWALTLRSVSYAFLSEDEKKALLALVIARRESVFPRESEGAL